MVRLLLIAAALLSTACARTPAAPDIAVHDAWARATAAGQSNAAIYATIANRGGADRLVGVSSSAGMAMLHASEASGGMARMRPVADLAIPAGGEVALAPGGTHVMVSGLAAPLRAGATVPLTLTFATSAPRTVDVAVVAAGAR
jgi:copper(I)-binding protein